MDTAYVTAAAVCVSAFVSHGCSSRISAEANPASSAPAPTAVPGNHSMVFDVPCDKETVGTPDSVSAVRRAWFAEVSVAGLNPRNAPLVTAVGCDRVCFGNGCVPSWAPNPSFKVSGYEPPEGECSPRPVLLFPDKVVVDCGSSHPGPTMQGFFDGMHYRRAYVRVAQP